MNKDIKLQLALAKMAGETCLAIEIPSIMCGTFHCKTCPYYNNPNPIYSEPNFSKVNRHKGLT